LTLTATVTSNINCNGANTGSAVSEPSGGTTPYTYSWSNGETSATATGLSAGIYTVSVSDNNGCAAVDYVIISQPPAITVATIVTNNVSCYGGSNGLAKAGTGGGMRPYTYSWSPNNSSTYIAAGLSAGIYIITVTDNKGCSATAEATITQPEVLVDSVASILYAVCPGRTGSATIGATGGTLPYAYTWSPPVSSTTTATGLTARSYVVVARDSQGCSAAVTFNISQPAGLRDSIVRASAMNILCNGENTGNATMGAKYGTSPYTYLWSNGVTNSTASGLSAGIYTVNINDSCGSSSSLSVTITQPPALSITADSLNATGGNCNGSAWAIVSGGTNPYTYLWTGGLTTDTIINQCTNYYCCIITDANGCMDSVCIHIDVSTGISQVKGGPDSYRDEKVKVYPNPNNGSFILSISNINTICNIEIYNILGEKILNEIVSRRRTTSLIFRLNLMGFIYTEWWKKTEALSGKGK
jgi:hypothetical protein